jgi:hypothetical protein
MGKLKMDPNDLASDDFPAQTNSTPPESTPGNQSPPFDDGRFVLNTTIFLLAWFTLFAVFSWPRLFTRFSRGSEWTHGHFVYHSTKPQRPPPAVKRRPTVSRPHESRHEKRRVPNSDDDHTTFSHIGLVRREETCNAKFSLPPHRRSWSGRYQKPSAILGVHLSEGYSLGQCIILLGYFAIFLYASLYKSSPFQEYVRTGFVSTAQIPIVFALATKNNIIGKFLSMGYEKVKTVPLPCILGVPPKPHVPFTPAQLPSSVRRRTRHRGCQFPRPGLW